MIELACSASGPEWHQQISEHQGEEIEWWMGLCKIDGCFVKTMGFFTKMLGFFVKLLRFFVKKFGLFVKKLRLFGKKSFSGSKPKLKKIRHFTKDLKAIQKFICVKCRLFFKQRVFF
jgi:hypothetical protein